MTHIRKKNRFHSVSLFCTLFCLHQFSRTTYTLTNIMDQCKYFIAFERSNSCLKIISPAFHIQRIFYFF